MQSFKMIFSGVTILQGVEFPIFPIDFAWALQQCSATALPVIAAYLGQRCCDREPFLSKKIYENIIKYDITLCPMGAQTTRIAIGLS